MIHETPAATNEEPVPVPEVTPPPPVEKKPAVRRAAAKKKAATAKPEATDGGSKKQVKRLKKDLRGAKAEIAALQSQLVATLKREKELMLFSEKKFKKMTAAGKRWEKKQLAKMKKAAKKSRKKLK